MRARSKRVLLFCIGLLALWVNTILVTGVLSAGLGEPYLDFETYLAEVWKAASFQELFLFLAIGPLGLAIGILSATDFRRPWRPFAVEAIRWVIPVAIWSLAFMIEKTNDPDLQINTPLPDWMSSPIFSILGAPTWLIVFAILAYRNLYVGLKGLREAPTESISVQNCNPGYN